MVLCTSRVTVFAAPATCFNILYSAFNLSQCTNILHMNFTINSNYFPKLHQPVGFVEDVTGHVMLGTESWNTIYMKFRFQCVWGGLLNQTVWTVNRGPMMKSERSGWKQRCAPLKKCLFIFVGLRNIIKPLRAAGLCTDSQTRNFTEYSAELRQRRRNSWDLSFSRSLVLRWQFLGMWSHVVWYMSTSAS